MFVLILLLNIIDGVNAKDCSSRYYKSIRRDGPSLPPDEIISSHKVKAIDVEIYCHILCDAESRCVGFNSKVTATNDENCQLTNVTKNKITSKRGYWTLFYDIYEIDECTEGTHECHANATCSNTRGSYNCICPRGKNCQNLKVPKSCHDIQKYNNTLMDGEYLLQITYPKCNQTVQIYCADMNTSQPREYLTLKAGPENNFSKKNYVNSPAQNTRNSSETQFAKIRIGSNLAVQRDDFRFATVTWYHLNQVYYAYAAAADCYSYSCTGTRHGVFKMSLTGTGMKFVTPIDWVYAGYPACRRNIPDQYSVSATKQVVSGRCGGYCGECKAKNLKVEPKGC